MLRSQNFSSSLFEGNSSALNGNPVLWTFGSLIALRLLIISDANIDETVFYFIFKSLYWLYVILRMVEITGGIGSRTRPP